jgi:prepilin-type N-terminal cleavage/methylation domain-containing protein
MPCSAARAKPMPPRNPNAEQPAIREMRNQAKRARGFSLMEMMVVLTILGILAAVVIPYFETTAVDQLQAGATVLVADIDYARSLAIANGSDYRLTFQPATNRYQLTHSGSNSLLHALPSSPFKLSTDTATTQTTRLDHLSLGSGELKLLGALRASGAPAELTNVTFTPLGSTVAAEDTLVWLTSGLGTARRYVAVRVSAITGLATVEQLTATAPTGLAALSSLR